MNLKQFFFKYKKVAVAFSGGVDSSYLLYVAKKYAKEVKAYYVKSEFQPSFEFENALKFVSDFGIDLKVIKLSVLSNKQIISNPVNRCYFCKKQIFSTIYKEALKDGFNIIVDGTNASDEESDRPGMKALKELSVLSPLKLCKITKSDVRKLSKKENLPTWNKISYTCLATRIATGQRIDKYLLQRTEKAEKYLFSLGFIDFRVRTVGVTAKIQIRKEQFPLIVSHRKKIFKKLLADYKTVCLDMEARNERGIKTNS